MIPVSAPPRVRDRLREAGDGPVPVVHRGPHAVYLDVAGRCVGLVSRRATAVPCALRCATERLPVPGRSAHLRDGVVHLDGTPLVVGRIVDVTVPRLGGWSGDTHGRSGCSGTVQTTTSSVGVPRAPWPVAEMVGRGDGLTPYDDDVLCGWLALHRAAGVATPEVDAAVRACLDRTTLLSATLLECAMEGEVVPEFAAYVAALGTPAEADRAAELAAVGHTSGAGMLRGAGLALAVLAGSREAA